MHDLTEQLRSLLKVVWRNRWLGVISAWVIALCGWAVVEIMPDRYQADARVYVDTQSVLRPLLIGLAVQPNMDQMVTMMSRTLISRPNLEKVIGMANLADTLKSGEDREKLIARLGKDITIKSAGGENLYTITYVDNDPMIAKHIVQSLLTLFVEGSAGDKRKDSDSARHFIEEQLQTNRERLVAAENAITAFKRRHMGLLPGEGPGYYARLSETKATLNKAELDLNEAENSRDSIKKQLASETDSELVSQTADKTIAAKAIPESELDGRIHALEQRLDTLRLSYTEQHPDIVALVPMIAQLKAQKKLEVQTRESLPVSARPKSPVNQQLTVALTTAEANVAAIRTRVAEYKKRYFELQADASAMPQVEAEFTQLTRDYDVTKMRYDELLKRRDSAQMSGDMEASNVATAFQVVDPAHVPFAPKAPNRPLLMSLVLLGALVGGLAIAIVAGQMKPTFSDEQRLREVTGLQVLGTVALASTETQNARRIRGLIGFAFSLASLLSAYAAIMAAFLITASKV
jgi:polysaccharide chain length determinant protein (PEP-CTERM system associated)